MKRRNFLIIMMLLVTLSMTGCQKDGQQGKEGNSMQQEQNTQAVQEQNSKEGQLSTESVSQENPVANTYTQITQEEAKEIMDTDEDAVILDVRSQEEYDSGHIPDAILIPHDQIADLAATSLPEQDQQILVYCRSGNRSRIAAEALAGLGYTNVKEFGGINTWPYEVEQ